MIFGWFGMVNWLFGVFWGSLGCFHAPTPRPGTPRLSYKSTLFVAYNWNQMYISSMF